MLLVVLFCASDSGIGLESGVYVTAIVQGSPAAREGSLTVGDRLIAVSACWKSFLKFFFLYTAFLHIYLTTAHTGAFGFLIQALVSTLQTPR